MATIGLLFGAPQTEFYWPARDDRGSLSAYDPYSPQDAVQGDEFGYAVDIDGNYAVIGSPGKNGQNGRVVLMKKDLIFGFWNPSILLME
jgi:FG-GAP repeat